MNDTTESMFFFLGGSGANLLGFTHMPTNDDKNTGIVYCHPFGEERNCSHFIAANAAREFAKHGYPVLRFDFSGCGDSEGAFEEFTLENWCNDITAAIQQLKERARVERIILWGLRLGAGLAMHYSAVQHNISALLLWQPILDLQGYVKQFLRNQIGSNIVSNGDGFSVKSLIAELETGEKVEVFGYRLNPLMYKSFLEMGRKSIFSEANCPIFFASISQMEKAPLSMIRSVAEMKNKCPIVEHVHIPEEPFWDRYERWESPEVISRTVEWLDNH